jgi:hypothetical protein
MLLVLWGFALLTGAGPSIVRAAVMFSFIIIATMVKQNSSILNALAAPELKRGMDALADTLEDAEFMAVKKLYDGLYAELKKYE